MRKKRFHETNFSQACGIKNYLKLVSDRLAEHKLARINFNSALRKNNQGELDFRQACGTKIYLNPFSDRLAERKNG
ncbi:MAG: hypothetical protein P1P88_16080 [Bacteroidales bacterium]|nr:hypothetical protein [Bacteroidales bacterium]